MAAEVILTEEYFSVIKKVVWKWKAHTDGKVEKTTDNSETKHIYNGELVRLITIPDTTAAPTDKYDIKIIDDDSMDVLIGAGADRSGSVAEQVLAANLGVVANDKLTLEVENAGSGGKGTVILYIR